MFPFAASEGSLDICRFEHDQGAIKVRYGIDHVTGFFIMVTDTRLAESFEEDEENEEGEEGGESETGEDGDDSALKDFNQVVIKIDEVGAGTYLNAHTGKYGIGPRVDKSTMKKFWGLYGAPEEYMKLIEG